MIGIIGYVFSIIDGNTSWTALIPAIFGLVLDVLGIAAKKMESLRKHLMHAAVVVGLLGFLASAGRILSRINDLTVSLAVFSQVAMAVICLVFVLLCVKSFINARKNPTV